MSDDSNAKNNLTQKSKPGVEAPDDRLKQRVEKLEQKKYQSTTEFLLNNFIAFVAGLVLGGLIALYIVWDEKKERKELRKELIEYVDKMFTRTVTIGEMMYKDMQANQQNTEESKPKDDGVVDGDFKDLNK